MKIKEDEQYEVRFYYPSTDYTWTVITGSELIALISKAKSSCPKYYELNGILYNLDRYYKIAWNVYREQI